MKSLYAAGFAVLLVLSSICGTTHAAVEGRLAGYLMRIEPYKDDAEKFSKATLGGGFQVIIAAPRPHHYVAGVFGFEGARLQNQKIYMIDRLTGLDVEQITNHDYFRLFLGPRFGPQGRGFLHPYVGVNVAVAFYSINSDLVVHDDYDRTKEIRQNVERQQESVLGYDFNLGLELNFQQKFFIDVGGRYVQNLDVEQQLGETKEMIKPTYIEVYLGAAFGWGG